VWDVALSVTIGLAIPAAARALGALPVFAFLTLPASAALLLRVRLATAFALATAFGVLAAGGGYLASWFGETPTGATMVVAAALFLLPGVVFRRVRA
jgi:zinc transport system permease protein